MTTTQEGTATRSLTPAGVAQRLEEALRPFVGGDLPVRLRAWDGSEAGPVDAPLVELRSKDAIRRMLWHPGELGAAQAYVTGEIEVHHDLDAALTHVWAVAAERGLSGVRPTPAAFARALRTAIGVGALGTPPAPPRLAGQVAWTAAQQAARQPRDQPPLRPVERVLLTDPRAADGLLLGLLHLRRPVVHGGGRAARQARPGLPQARARARDALPRHRLRLGLALAARRPALRRPGHRRHHRRGAEEVHRRPHRRARSAGPGRDPAAGLPRDPGGHTGTAVPSTPSGRSRWASTSARRTTPPTRASCTTPSSPADGC